MSASCCTGLAGCGCQSCRPAFSAFVGTCTDPGSSDYLTYLSGFDPQFCPTRLLAGAGLLQSVVDGSGNFQISFQPNPQLNLPDFTVAADATFGDLVIIGADNKLNRLTGPASKFAQTNAAGQVFFGSAPAAIVPDPLTVQDLVVGNTATVVNLTLSGSFAASGLSAGTIANFLGLDNANNVVKQTLTGLVVQTAMFFESPTSPGASYPNENKAAGDNLVIGNLLFDSGATLINVTDSVSLTVAVAGDYTIQWGAMLNNTGGVAWKTGVQLTINNIIVSNGGINPARNLTNAQGGITASCTFSRSLAVGDVIRLQLSSQASANAKTYEVWLNATRIGS